SPAPMRSSACTTSALPDSIRFDDVRTGPGLVSTTTQPVIPRRIGIMRGACVGAIGKQYAARLEKFIILAGSLFRITGLGISVLPGRPTQALELFRRFLGSNP